MRLKFKRIPAADWPPMSQFYDTFTPRYYVILPKCCPITFTGCSYTSIELFVPSEHYNSSEHIALLHAEINQDACDYK